MKTTLEIPDDLFRQTKATAAIRGESLKDFVAEALKAHLERRSLATPSQPGWRNVFGKASREAVEAVDAIVARDLETIDPADWQ